MALTPAQQTIEQIQRASRILIVTKERPDHDALSAAVACSLFFKKQKKTVDIVAPGVRPEEIPSFLPERTMIQSTPGAMRASHITLDLSRTPLGELLYDVKDGKLAITVVPKSGEWTEADVQFKHGGDRYDLVVSVGAQDLASLGDLSRTHADFLYRTTIINIDCDPGNEHWGQVNLVDLNAVAVSEVLYRFFEEWNRNLLDADIATALLAGMIARTKSFRTPNVTPRTLSAAAELVSMGGRREEIVHGLWRTKDVATLKLWGRALSRLSADTEVGLAWATLSHNDILETGAIASSVEGVVDELLTAMPSAKVVALIYEPDSTSPARVSLHALPPFSAAELARSFGATGTRSHASFSLAPGTPLADGARTTIDRLRDIMKTLRA